MVHAVLAVVLSAGCTRGPAAIPGLSEDENHFIHALEDSGARSGGLWPQFSALFIPVLVHFEREPVTGTGVSVLLAHPAPPAGFRPVRDGVSLREDSSPPIGSWFRATEVAGRRTFAWRVKAGSERLAELQMFAHEQFHVFQEARGWRFRHHDEALPRPDGTDPATRADATIESSLLARALRDDGAFEQHARDFASLRTARRALGPQRDAAWEDAQEALEGTAAYMDARFFAEYAMRLPQGSATARNIVVARLLGDSHAVGAEFKWRYYGSGAAQGLLLDRAGVPWRERVASGEALFDIFRLRFPPDDRAAIRIRDGHEHPRLALAARETIGEERRDRTRRARAFEHPEVLRLELSFPRGSRLPSLAGFLEGLPLDFAGFDIAFDSLWAESADADRLTLRFDGVRAAYRLAPVPAILALIGETTAVAVDGRPSSLPSTPRSFKTLALDAPGVFLRTQRPGTFVRTGSALRVTFGPEQAP